MTKREHKALQKEFNKMMEYDHKATEAFERLQELNGTEGTGKRYCSAEHNYKDLLSMGKDYTYLYNNYVKYRGMYEAASSLGSTLAELDFWKK